MVGGKGYSVDLRGTGRMPSHALYLMEPKIGLSPYANGVMRVAGIFELPGKDDRPRTRRTGQIVEQTIPFLAIGGRTRTDGSCVAEPVFARARPTASPSSVRFPTPPACTWRLGTGCSG